MEFGITPEGFEQKRLEDIKSEIETDFKSSFGDDIDVSPESVMGSLVSNMIIPLTELWELGSAVYASQDPDQANDISLDRTSQLILIQRLAATATVVNVIAAGDEGTVIDDTFIAKQNETDNLFRPVTGFTVTLTKAGCIQATYSINTVADTTVYSITINGTVFDITSDGSATDLEIMAALKVDIDAGSEPVIVTDNLDGTLTTDADDNITPFSTDTSANMDIDEVGGLLIVDADDLGAISVPVNTITIIDTPVSGLNSITNPLSGTIGRDLETDSELRQRRRDSQKIAGAGTDEAIRTRLLQDVPSVTQVTVVSNRTDVTDGEGRPPHSFEVVIVGGDDAAVASKIWEVQPSGIQSHGNTTEIVLDSQGNNQTINFSRPTSVYIHVNVVISPDTESALPVDWINQIKDNIVAFGLTLNTGNDVFRDKLFAPVTSVTGVGGAPTLEIDGTPNPGDTPTFSTSDEPIASDEIAKFDVSRIAVASI